MRLDLALSHMTEIRNQLKLQCQRKLKQHFGGNLRRRQRQVVNLSKDCAKECLLNMWLENCSHEKASDAGTQEGDKSEFCQTGRLYWTKMFPLRQTNCKYWAPCKKSACRYRKNLLHVKSLCSLWSWSVSRSNRAHRIWVKLWSSSFSPTYWNKHGYRLFVLDVLPWKSEINLMQSNNLWQLQSQWIIQ